MPILYIITITILTVVFLFVLFCFCAEILAEAILEIVKSRLFRGLEIRPEISSP